MFEKKIFTVIGGGFMTKNEITTKEKKYLLITSLWSMGLIFTVFSLKDMIVEKLGQRFVFGIGIIIILTIMYRFDTTRPSWEWIKGKRKKRKR